MNFFLKEGEVIFCFFCRLLLLLWNYSIFEVGGYGNFLGVCIDNGESGVEMELVFSFLIFRVGYSL